VATYATMKPQDRLIEACLVADARCGQPRARPAPAGAAAASAAVMGA